MESLQKLVEVLNSVPYASAGTRDIKNGCENMAQRIDAKLLSFDFELRDNNFVNKLLEAQQCLSSLMPRPVSIHLNEVFTAMLKGEDLMTSFIGGGTFLDKIASPFPFDTSAKHHNNMKTVFLHLGKCQEHIKPEELKKVVDYITGAEAKVARIRDAAIKTQNESLERFMEDTYIAQKAGGMVDGSKWYGVQIQYISPLEELTALYEINIIGDEVSTLKTNLEKFEKAMTAHTEALEKLDVKVDETASAARRVVLKVGWETVYELLLMNELGKLGDKDKVGAAKSKIAAFRKQLSNVKFSSMGVSIHPTIDDSSQKAVSLKKLKTVATLA